MANKKALIVVQWYSFHILVNIQIFSHNLLLINNLYKVLVHVP